MSVAAEKNNLHQVTVANFGKFVEQIESYDFVADLVIFRGQSVKGNLRPKVARKDPKINTTASERKVLNQLRLQGASFLKGQSDLDLLVYAQHFGLATRLLDWSSNPLVALWFACADPSASDAYVYGLEANNLLLEDIAEHDPFVQSQTKVFQPRFDNPRIIAQHGWFTLHKYSTGHDRFVALETNPNMIPHLTEFRIPQASKAPMLKSLDRYGIGNRTLFPDFEGVCRHLNWKYELI